MELTNIVYSSTLIFLLILSSLFLFGFVGSQYRKVQLKFSDKRMPARNRSVSHNNPLVSAQVHYAMKDPPASAISGANIKFTYYDEVYLEKEKMSKSSRPVNTVSRGSLVREHYNQRKFYSVKTERIKDVIRFK